MRPQALRTLPLVVAGLLLAGWQTPSQVTRGPRQPISGIQGRSEEAISTAALCVGAIRDQATGACLRASSTPMLGRLYPLGGELFIDPLGRVGVGTITPIERMDVQGVIRSAVGGYRFPDGTLQASAALPARGEPQNVLGDVQIAGLPCPTGPIPIYSLNHTVSNAGGSPIFSLAFSKDVDGCSAEIVKLALNGATTGDMVFTLGGVRLTARQPVLESVEMVAEEGLPREKVTLVFSEIEYDHTPSGTSANWNVALNLGSSTPSFAGSSLRFVIPDLDPLSAGEYEVRASQQSFFRSGGISHDDFELTKVADTATPSLAIACAAGQLINDIEVVRMKSDGVKDVEYLKYTLQGCRITSVQHSVDPLDGFLETVSFDFSSIKWDFVVSGMPTTAP